MLAGDVHELVRDICGKSRSVSVVFCVVWGKAVSGCVGRVLDGWLERVGIL